MRYSGLLVFVCALACVAQTLEDPDVARARTELNRIRAMVETGAFPRAQLVKAQEAVDDAVDAATIKHTIYATDLTEEQGKQLIAAATRRRDRRQRAYDDMKKLVDVGVMPAQTLAALQQDLDFARKEVDLAQDRADLAQEIAAMAEAEAAAAQTRAAGLAEGPKVAERFDGDGVFTPTIFAGIEAAYEHRFGRALPVSANGETAVHRALGFDHRGRVDVALRPDQPEGIWLLDYLRSHRIPYFAFSQAVPGKATGAHIHLGLPSTRLPAADAGG
jgi:hypothetical protein